EALCCGGGGLLKAVNQGLESALALRRLRQAEAVGAEAVVSGCPSCKMTLSDAAERRGGGISVLDISEITAYALGILPPEIRRASQA
ncbi:MAG: heterodisulfide reductase-related iron-sulfur binding cluster, partial [Candidatus Bathyarchaeia archaeon]